MKYYKAREDFAVKKITEKNVLIPTGEQVFRNNSMIIMNETGILLWEKLCEFKNLSELTIILCEEFEVTADTVKGDVERFISTLLNVDAVEVKDIKTDTVA